MTLDDLLLQLFGGGGRGGAVAGAGDVRSGAIPAQPAQMENSSVSVAQPRQPMATPRPAPVMGDAPIDMSRPKLNNPNGSFSTERTIGIEMDGRNFNIPTIVDGVQRTPEEAIELFRQGKNKAVGEFRSQAEADAAAPLRSNQIGALRGGAVPDSPVAAGGQTGATGSLPQQAAAGRPAPNLSLPDTSPSLTDRIGSVFAGLSGPDALATYNQGVEKRRGADMGRFAANKTYQALVGKGEDPEMAAAAVANPEIAKALIGKHFGGNPTELARNYAIAQGQGFKGTLVDFMKETKGPLVSIGEENAFAKETGKQFAQRYSDLQKGSQNASNMMGLYDAAEAAIATGVRTGFAAPQEKTLRRIALSLGVDSEENITKLKGAELLDGIQNRTALLMRNPDGGMGMPGALSDADREFLRASQVGLDKSPAGNQLMLGVLRRLEQRKIEMAQLATAYVQSKGRLDVGFDDVMRDYATKNPLFADLSTSPSPPPTGGGGQGTIRTYNPETGRLE